MLCLSALLCPLRAGALLAQGDHRLSQSCPCMLCICLALLCRAPERSSSHDPVMPMLCCCGRRSHDYHRSN